MERAEPILAWLVSIPGWLVYLLVGLAAALENIVPPIPADVIVVLAGVMAGASHIDVWLLFLAVWIGNVGSALLVYGLGRRYGATFFEGRVGSFLLAPGQVASLEIAYQRFGFPIIFFSRFLPVFRPIVPVFAGVAKLSFPGTALPIALASAVWYGFLVYLGNFAAQNWRRGIAFVADLGLGLWVAAAILLLALGVWWWRSRHPATPVQDAEE